LQLKDFPIGTQPSTGKAAEKEQKLFESATGGRVFLIPAALTQGIRRRRTSDRVPFLLVRFLWASKENEHKVSGIFKYG